MRKTSLSFLLMVALGLWSVWFGLFVELR